MTTRITANQQPILPFLLWKMIQMIQTLMTKYLKIKFQNTINDIYLNSPDVAATLDRINLTEGNAVMLVSSIAKANNENI
jgi:hypothetical protein